MTDWYGFYWTNGSFRGSSLHVGPLPRRKSVCLFEIDGSVITPLAYFRDEESARRALDLIEGLVEGRVVEGADD